MTKRDAFNLPNVDGPEVSLEQDLFEQSNRVYHRHVAQYQLIQQRTLAAHEAAIRRWLENELKKPGANDAHLNSQAKKELKEARSILSRETAGYMAEMRIEEEARNQAIPLFIFTGKNPPRPRKQD